MIEITMAFKKETPRTFVFENADSPVKLLYVQKEALGEQSPKTIKVTVSA